MLAPMLSRWKERNYDNLGLRLCDEMPSKLPFIDCRYEHLSFFFDKASDKKVKRDDDDVMRKMKANSSRLNQVEWMNAWVDIDS